MIIIKNDVLFIEDLTKSLRYYVSEFFSKILEDTTRKTYEMISNEVLGSNFNCFRFVFESVVNSQF